MEIKKRNGGRFFINYCVPEVIIQRNGFDFKVFDENNINYVKNMLRIFMILARDTHGLAES